MLVNKPYAAHDVITFKLVNGDEIIAFLESETPTTFMIKQPVVVSFSEKGVGLIQAVFTGDLKNSIPLSKEHVMMHVLTTDQASDHYVHTVTGIKPVRNKIIV